MIIWVALFTSLLILFTGFFWIRSDRKYHDKYSVSSAYDSWTNDFLLERLWGEHIHLGYYERKTKGFREAKVDFVHKLVYWSGLHKLPKGSRILDVGCGIGGSARILANDYGFDVLGITVSSAQVRRAIELTKGNTSCRFAVMDAMNLDLENGSFDGVWSVEAGPHMPNKQLYADEMLRVLRPGGVLAVADWNQRDYLIKKRSFLENLVLKQLLNQWAHPEFATIKGFQQNLALSDYSGGPVDIEDWTEFVLPSWNDSIFEGFRRPKVFIDLGPKALINGIREVPTILLMRWAFANGLMQFGVFRSRG